MSESGNGDGYMASASQDGYIKYWNIKKYNFMKIFILIVKLKVS